MTSTTWSLKKRVLIFTIVYLSLSIFEHLSFLATDIYKLNLEIVTCNLTDVDRVEMFIKNNFGTVLSNLPWRYNQFLGFFLVYLNFSYTFYWNFLDLFIIIISIGVGYMFEKINSRLHYIIGLTIAESVWEEIRQHHLKVSELLQSINENISEMIILACLSDGYFILCQMINITT